LKGKQTWGARQIFNFHLNEEDEQPRTDCFSCQVSLFKFYN